VASDPIGDGLAFGLAGGTGENNQSGASSLFAKPGAVAALRYSNGRIAALRYDGAHRVFHCGFGFEGVSTQANRDSLMSRALRWLCPAEGVAPAVQVLDPNGGENLTGLAHHTIHWTATDGTAVLAVDLLLSTDGGAHWTPIATGVPNSYAYDWTVDTVNSSQCRIRVQASDPWSNVGSDSSDADFTITTATSDATTQPVPRRFALHPAIPNPFNPTTRLDFDLPRASAVRLEVVTVDGRRVRVLAAGEQLPAGTHTLSWDGRDDEGRVLAAGVYLVRMRAGDFTTARKVQLVK
jgi:hypothetical protein